MLAYTALCVAAQCCWAYDQSVPVQPDGSSYVLNELTCMLAGGTCMVASNCPLREQNYLKSYCPYQEERGVVCCHGIPNSKTKCRERTGECVSDCPSQYIERKATDCAENEVCCILVT